jgi:hypothetical protein
MQVPVGDDVLLQVLTHIFEMVRRLPPGAERIAALEQIRDFQTRLGLEAGRLTALWAVPHLDLGLPMRRPLFVAQQLAGFRVDEM